MARNRAQQAVVKNAGRTAYLDSNVYDAVHEFGVSSDVRSLLQRHRLSVLASGVNLSEMLVIPNLALRASQIQTLTAVASRFEETPGSYRDAQEVLSEIRRLRPAWLTRFPRKRSIERFLQTHRARWDDAHRNAGRGIDAAQYKEDSESGIRTSREFQKNLRSRRPLTGDNFVLMRTDGEQFRHVGTWKDDPETFWRMDSMTAWHKAIIKRHPASRDYYDWLSPWLKADAWSDGSDYERFWLEEVSGERLPRNRMKSIMTLLQLEKKITHGNTRDTQHATYLLETDVVVTADRAFFSALEAVGDYFESPGRATLIERSENPVDELERVLTLPEVLGEE